MAADQQNQPEARTINDQVQELHNAPIGIFDSGVGGLSVLREVRRRLPGESVIYFADTAHVPYGGRPLDEVRGFALSICRFLVDHGAKMIIMACNISSAVAIDAARIEFPDIPILGVIEPGSRAALAGNKRRVGVLATEGTVQSGAYPRVIRGLNPQANVEQVGCPLFVPLVERGETESVAAVQAALSYLSRLAAFNADTVILGCTHYPFLRRTLDRAAEELFDPGAIPEFINPAIETVMAAEAALSSSCGAATLGHEGFYRYFVSGDVNHFRLHGSSFLGQSIEHAEKADPSLLMLA